MSVPRVLEEAERAWSRAVRALLQGRAPPPFPDPPPRRAALEERAAHGDAEAQPLLEAMAALAALPERVAGALAAESAPVILADGSRLSLDDAERLLAAKEERAAHRPLRDSLDRSLAPFQGLRFHDRRIDPEARALLEGFLRATGPLRDAAREALGTLGGQIPDGPPSLARALDLPDPAGAFGEPVATALLAGARDAARPVRHVTRLSAPRALAGAVLVDDVVSFAWPPKIARLDRFTRTLEAGAEALARGRGLPVDGAREAGIAFALGLAGSTARRRAGAGRQEAERAARAGFAAAVLRARAEVRLAVRADDEDARDVLVEALGADPGPALAAALDAAPWSYPAAVVARACARVRAPGLVLALRDRFDEGFALEADAWSDAVEHERETAGAADPAGVAWVRLAGELL